MCVGGAQARISNSVHIILSVELRFQQGKVCTEGEKVGKVHKYPGKNKCIYLCLILSPLFACMCRHVKKSEIGSYFTKNMSF